jgi:predicted nucleic acid-binding protein
VILVDSSVWIANLRGLDTESVRKLAAIDNASERILVGDLILMEVLMGARDEATASRIEREMRRFDIVVLTDPVIALDAARNYRFLRRLGVTVRTGIDVVIGTWCIRHGHTLLHDDRDFVPMVRHLGLSVL